MIEQGDILSLDDGKEYTVVAVTEYENKKYCYIIETDDTTNINFYEIIDNEELEEVEDEELRNNLIEKFNEILNN